MANHFTFLGSSSSGNCGLLKTDRSTILVDLGFSARRTHAYLGEIGMDMSAIDGVFLTHEHGDHAVGLSGLSKYPELPIYANRDTAKALQSKLKWRPNWRIFTTGQPFAHADLKIHPFSVPHDAYDPVGFRFDWGEGDLFSPFRSLAWVTDLGYVPDNVKSLIHDVDTLVVESNYDQDMLESDTKRPFSVKQRIRGRHGHLSNQDVYALFSEIKNPRWRQVALVHLSRDCNELQRVSELMEPLVSQHHRFQLSIIDPHKSGPTPLFF